MKANAIFAALRERIELASRVIEQIFEKDGRIYQPMLDASTDDKRIISAVPQTGDRDLDAALLRAGLERLGVRSYVMMHEAWRVESTDMAVMQQAIEHGAASSPCRVEGVLFSAEDHNGQLTAWRAIIRDGDKPRLGPLEVDTDITQS